MLSDQILDFWFKELTPQHWFGGGPALDDIIRERFGAQLESAKQGQADGWASSPRGRLALIILLDQFSRNIFRGKPEAFAADAKAQKLTLEGLDAGMDKPLMLSERLFFYMPLVHAENTQLQALSVEKFVALREEAEKLLWYARKHESIVAQFGRFPHRNAIMRRPTTPEEESFLAAEGNIFS